MALTASAMTPVASHPKMLRRWPTTNFPMIFVLATMRIITNIIGTDITPLITAAQYSALIGSIPLHAPGWRSSMRSLARATSYILRMRSSIWLQRGLRWTTSRKHSAWHGPGGLWVYASELQPYWADYLALIAMLEGRPRTSARLAGYADIGYAGREQDRAHNETAAIERASVLARTALGDAEFERLYVNGGALQDGEIATLAFATEDSVGATVRADFVWVATANRGVARPPSSLRNCLALCALR